MRRLAVDSFLAIVIVGTLALAFVASSLDVTLRESGRAFGERIGEDTRSGQIQSFFDDVAVRELVLGRGAMATWNWRRMSSEWSGTDIGYLSLLFYGGVPLLATYFVTHVLPPIQTLRSRPVDHRLACAAIGILWSMRMCSSSFPTLDLTYYPGLLCVGACIPQRIVGSSTVRLERARRAKAPLPEGIAVQS
jgi:hypothetical protein